MSNTKLENLDRHLKIQTGRSDMLLGGVHIVFAGDFYQIPPVLEEKKHFIWVTVYNGGHLMLLYF